MKVKKRSGGGGANWMDTYGDMVTLLLCFFVLLYSMSTISEENWKAIVMSFNPNAVETPTETSGGGGPSADFIDEGGYGQADIEQDMEQLLEDIQNFVVQQHQESNVTVTAEGGRIYISFNQVVFFDGDSPVLKKEAEPVLEELSVLFDKASDAIDQVRVLGHTAQADPDEPNTVRGDRTLASMRATNVVIFLQEHTQLDPVRLISEGIGQWRPVDTNATPEGRARNRRVEMIISGRNLEQELGGNISQYDIAS